MGHHLCQTLVIKGISHKLLKFKGRECRSHFLIKRDQRNLWPQIKTITVSFYKVDILPTRTTYFAVMSVENRLSHSAATLYSLTPYAQVSTKANLSIHRLLPLDPNRCLIVNLHKSTEVQNVVKETPQVMLVITLVT